MKTMKRLNNKKLTFALMACAAGLTMACAGKEDYDGLDHKLPEGDVAPELKVVYNVKLNDPNVYEAATVKVQYIDSLGNTIEDDMTGNSWTKTVTYKKTVTMNFGLAAHYFALQNPQLTKAEYGFGADLTSMVYQMYTSGDSLQIARFKSEDKESTGVARWFPNGIIPKSEAATPEGNAFIDSTMVYFRLTSVKNDSAMVRSKFTWKK